MEIITELSIVNACLNSIGETRVNSITGSTNPMVTNARTALQRTMAQEQSTSWWFNTETVTLAPLVDGRYQAPSDTLELSTQRGVNPGWMTLRGNYIYDTDGGKYHTGTRPLKVRLVRILPLSDIPYTGQQLIQAATIYRFLIDFDGDELKLRGAADDYEAAYAMAMAAHTRAVGANMLGQGSVSNARVRSTVPYSTWRP